jgi:ArsR family transcriptional regulator, virulence genes transcriptional regulator
MITDPDALSAAADDASEFLKSLASPVRLRILCTIIGKEASVGELADQLGVRQSVASQHLALLRKDGLVRTRREGQTIWYGLADERVIRIMDVLQQTFCPAPEAEVREAGSADARSPARRARAGA